MVEVRKSAVIQARRGVEGEEGRARRQNLSCASMKGQFIRSCSGRQNILPQCFTDCLDEEWEHISAEPGPGLGWAGAEAGAATTWHSPITVCCKHPWGSWIRGTRGYRSVLLQRWWGCEGINPDISTKPGLAHDYKLQLFQM